MISLIAIASSLAQSIAAPPPEQSTALQQSADAQFGTFTTVDLEGGVGFSTNPQLQPGTSGQAFGRLSVYAAHVRQSSRSSTVFSAFGENTTYSGGSGSQQLLRATASHQVALTEKLRVFGDASASLDRGGQLGNRFIGSPNAPLATAPDIIPVFPDSVEDLSLIGASTYRLTGQAGAQVALSLRDSLTFSAGAEHVVFRNVQMDNDYTSLFASSGWNRVLSERASAGLRVNVRRASYSMGRSSLGISPQVTGRLQISERLAMDGAVGASFAQDDTGDNTRSSVGLTFNGSLCGRRPNETFCTRVSRDHQSETFNGPSVSNSVDANYSRQLDQKQSIQLTAGASRQSQRFDDWTASGLTGKQNYIRAAAAYTRKMGIRWLTGANVSARSLRGAGANPTDLSASVFVRWRAGDLR